MTNGGQSGLDDYRESELVPNPKFRPWDIMGVITVFAMPLIFCNWVHEWRMVDWGTTIANDLPDYIPESQVRITAAGWPWVYYRHFQQYGTHASSLSFLLLCANAIVAVLYVGLMTNWLVRQRRQWALRQLQFSLRDVFYAGILIAPFLFAWTRERSIQRIEAEIVERHSSYLGERPVLVQRFPRCLAVLGSNLLSRASFKRVEFMYYDLARPEIDTDASQLHLATRVVFQSSDEARTSLDSLPRQDSVLRAEFRRLELSDTSVQAVGSWPNMTVFEFKDCRLDLAALNEKPPCSTARYLLASDSKIGGSKIQWQSIFPKLVSLQLPVPEETPATYHIHDHPTLQRVIMSNERHLQHRASCKLHLENLPELDNLHLTTFCKLDLKLKKLPKLELLTHNSMGYSKFLTDERGRPISNPLYSMMSRVQIEDLPLLKSMEFNIRHFESISIQETPNLQHLSISAAIRDSVGESEFPPELENACQRHRPGAENPFGLQVLFDELSKVHSIESLKVSHAPLVGVRFASLANMPKLKWLNLNSCYLRDEELLSLGPISRLERLELSDNYFRRFDSNQLPGLSSLQYLSLYKDEATFIPERSPESIVIDGWKTIREIRYEVSSKLKKVVMKDLPSAIFRLGIPTPMDELVLENVPGMHSLDIRSPISKSSRIAGVNGLRNLVVRHPSVSTSDFRRLENLEQLRSINVGTCKLSEELLVEIGQLPHLVYLVVHDTDTTDEVVKQWTCLKDLQGLDISGTKVTNEGLKYILENSNLTRLIIGNNDLDSQIGEYLSVEKQLQILSLRNLKLDPKDFAFLDELTNLYLIDLSGTGANSSIIEWLITDERLRGFVFENCSEIKNPAILKMIEGRLRGVALGATGSGLEAFVPSMTTNTIQVLEPGWQEGFWASYQIPQ